MPVSPHTPGADSSHHSHAGFLLSRLLILAAVFGAGMALCAFLGLMEAGLAPGLASRFLLFPLKQRHLALKGHYMEIREGQCPVVEAGLGRQF